MDKNVRIILEVILAISLSSITRLVSARQFGACVPKLNSCGVYEFMCSDGTCIKKHKYCNGVYDCVDGSDEDFCIPENRGVYSAHYVCKDASREFFVCSNDDKCIPKEWVCDGYLDCGVDANDENDCGQSNTLGNTVISARQQAVKWLHNVALDTSEIPHWRTHVRKSAVAFALSSPDFLLPGNSLRKTISNELTLQLLSELSHKRIQNIQSSDLASFIHAFIVTCIDPRDFYGFDLVRELRMRVENQTNTNPYALLALCNAGDNVTESDVKKLTDIFWGENQERLTDIQAIALLALSCAKKQPNKVVSTKTVDGLVRELKNRQKKKGVIENLRTTLLVLQALYSAEADEVTGNFDEKKALNYILQHQESSGSIQNILLTYYALPILNCKSLADINSEHCFKQPKDEEKAVFHIVNHTGPKMRVYYSIWIDLDKDITRTLTIRVPENTTFYGVMEIAAEIDCKYKFEALVQNRTTYINSVSGLLEDLEGGQFWFPYIVKNNTASLLEKSITDMIVKNEDHIVMWYRRWNWTD